MIRLNSYWQYPFHTPGVYTQCPIKFGKSLKLNISGHKWVNLTKFFTLLWLYLNNIFAKFNCNQNIISWDTTFRTQVLKFYWIQHRFVSLYNWHYFKTPYLELWVNKFYKIMWIRNRMFPACNSINEFDNS